MFFITVVISVASGHEQHPTRSGRASSTFGVEAGLSFVEIRSKRRGASHSTSSDGFLRKRVLVSRRPMHDSDVLVLVFFSGADATGWSAFCLADLEGQHGVTLPKSPRIDWV